MNELSKCKLKKYFYNELRKWKGFLLMSMSFLFIYQHVKQFINESNTVLPYELHILSVPVEFMMIVGILMDSYVLIIPNVIFSTYSIPFIYNNHYQFISKVFDYTVQVPDKKSYMIDGIMYKSFTILFYYYYIYTIYSFVYYIIKTEYWKLRVNKASVLTSTVKSPASTTFKV